VSATKNYILYVPSQNRYIEQAKHVKFVEDEVMKNTSDFLGEDMEDLQITVHKTERKVIPQQKTEKAEDSTDESGSEEAKEKEVAEENDSSPSSDTESSEMDQADDKKPDVLSSDYEDAENEIVMALTPEERSWADEMETDGDSMPAGTPEQKTHQVRRDRKPAMKYQAGTSGTEQDPDVSTS
jgi:hypothetical protein